MRSAAPTEQSVAAAASVGRNAVSSLRRANAPYGICTPRRRSGRPASGKSLVPRKLLAPLGFAILALLAVGASSAQAAISHPYTGTSFGPGGVGSGSFVNVQGVTVDQASGDVLVYDDAEGGRVYKFDAAGEPVDFSSTGTNVIEGAGGAGGAEEEIAVDDSTGPDAGDIYVANNSVVKIYSAAGAPLGELSGGEMCGVAVDPSGNVYVGVYPETVRRYAPSANPVTNEDQDASIGGLSGVCNVAVDAAGDVYAANYSGGVKKYDALQFGSLSASGELVDPQGRTLAVDPTSGEVFIDEVNQIAQYNGAAEPPTRLGVSGASGAPGALESSFGVGVDHASGELYAGDREAVEIFGPGVVVPGASTEGASSLTATEATVHGTVEPAGTEVTSCLFEYGTEAGALDHSVPCEPVPPYSGSAPVAVTAHLTGLSAGTAYRYRIVAAVAHGEVSGAEMSLTTQGPQVTAFSFPEVSTTKAVVRAEINPSGEATIYHVEYGTSTAYGSNTEDVELEPGEEPVTVSVPIGGLQPGTTYHFRFVASSAVATTRSADVEFMTEEVVTDEAFADVGTSDATVSADIALGGEPTSYEVEYGISGAYGSSTAPVSVGAGETPVAVEAHLEELQPDTTYHFRFVAISKGGTAVGPDLKFTTQTLGAARLPDGRGYEMVTPTDDEGAEPYPSIGSGFVEEDAVEADYPVAAAADGSAVAFVGSPTVSGNGNQGNGGGNEFYARRGADGWTQTNLQPEGYKSPSYWAFSPDLEHGVLGSEEPLAAGAPPPGYHDLYVRDNENGDYQPLFTGTPPNRSPLRFGSPRPGGYVPVESESLGQHYAGASADYTHLLFEANDVLASGAVDPGVEENNLYESVDGRARTVNVLPDGAAAPNASFGAAEVESFGGPLANFSHVISADGSRVFWTDMNTGSLYVRERGEVTNLVAEAATYVTASTNGSRVLYTKAGDLYEENLESAVTRDLAPGAEALGIAGASEDLEYIYLVARGTLASGSVAGKSNLYLLHDGQTRFIAALGTSREEAGANEVSYSSPPVEFIPWQPDLAYRTADVTPSGRGLVFTSGQSLTGYDNVGSEGRKAPEIYVYDADSGALTCASCDPTGQRPSKPAYGEPDALLSVSLHSTYQMRSISEDGSRVFFESTQPLVPQAQNLKRDIYEWERDGSGSCAQSNGCIYLLSSGTSPQASYLLDTSASGDDVFFIARSQLVPSDQNDLNDVYDARVGATEGAVPTQCTGTGCQGVAASPPVFATPASTTYEGVGNFPAAATPVVKPKPKAKKRPASCAKSPKKKAKRSAKQAKAKRKPVRCKARKAAARRARRANGRGGR
jgi:hypothetical protein